MTIVQTRGQRRQQHNLRVGKSPSVVSHERGTISDYPETGVQIISGAGHLSVIGAHLFRSRQHDCGETQPLEL